jgi:hypothetical protein
VSDSDSLQVLLGARGASGFGDPSGVVNKDWKDWAGFLQVQAERGKS